MTNDRRHRCAIEAAACLLVVAATLVHGQWTDRWSGLDVAAELVRGGALLERRFPKSIGAWKAMGDLEPDPRGLERAGAVGHVSRLYRHRDTGVQATVFVVCATPHDASGHTPDRCYPGSGFRADEAESRRSIDLEDGRTADVFTGTFTKAGQTLRIFWTYGGDGHWIAPPIARLGLAGRPLVHKLYVIVDATRLGAVEAKATGETFLAELLPAVDAALEDPAAAGISAAWRIGPGTLSGAGWCDIPPACAWRLAGERACAWRLAPRNPRHPGLGFLGDPPVALGSPPSRRAVQGGADLEAPQEAPGASPGDCSHAGWRFIPPACACRLAGKRPRPAARWALCQQAPGASPGDCPGHHGTQATGPA